MHDDEITCGAGLPCERTCPVMSMGRICPTLPEFIDELAALLTPVVEAPRTCLAPA